MHELMTNNPFATLVTLSAEGLCANHIPFELRKAPEPYGTLVGHVARANPVWQASEGKEAIVIFHGTNAYITPSWYPTKAETGKVVPTWNYAVVHAHGSVRVTEDTQWLRSHIENLTNVQESPFSHPWSVSDAPADFTEKLLSRIVGIEISVNKLSGKWKVSQNRSKPDKAGVVDGLRELGEIQMAELVAHGTGREEQ
jgi:transcriptional regulator